MSTGARRWWLAGAAVAAGVVVVWAAIAFRPALARWAGKRAIAELEQVTGGRVEARSIDWQFWAAKVALADVTIHGREAAGSAPYMHFDGIHAGFALRDVFGRQIDIREITFEHPVLHVVILPDGTTNVPTLGRHSGSAVEQLFAMQLGRAEARNGELFVNNRRTPFDFSANDVRFSMAYAAADQRYDGTLQLGRLETSYGAMRPFASTGALEFRLYRSKLELTNVTWSSGRSKLQATGTVSHFDDPEAEIHYDGAVDLAPWAATAGLGGVRGGIVQLRGTARYSPSEASTSGKVAARDLVYETPDLHLAGVAANGDFQVDRDKLLLSGLTARAAGGTASGEVEVSNWASLAASHPEQVGRAALHLRGLSLAQLISAAPAARRKFGNMNLVGTASGEMALAWRGSPRDADARISLEVAPPREDPPQQVPVTGRIDLSYSRKKGVQASNIDLTSQNGTRLQAHGTLGGKGSMQVSFATDEIAQFEPLLAALSLSEERPTNVRGRATFTGTIAGPLETPTIAGHLELANFDAMMAPIPFPGAPRVTARHPVHLDALATDVQYTPSLLAARHGSLRSGSVRAEFEINAQLRRGSFVPTSPVRAHVSVQRAAMADLQQLAGWHYPVEGTTTTSLDVTGAQGNWQGGGPVRVEDGAIEHQPFRSLSGTLRLAGAELRLQDLALAQDGGSVRGSAAYTAGSGAFRFDLDGSGFDVEKIPQLQWARLKVTGDLGFHATGEGTTAAPVINAQLRFRNLVLNQERAGDFDVDAVTHGADLQLNGATRLMGTRFRINGNVRLRDDYPATLELRFAQLDIDPLIEAASPAELTGHSSVTGSVNISGPLRRPRDLTGSGNLDQLRAYVENVELANQGPIRFSYANQVARVDELHLVGEDTDFKADGTVSLAAPGALDVHGDGRMNLKLLQSINPALVAYGRTVVAVAVSGTMAQPTVQGQVYIRDAGISYVDVPNGLSNINGTLVFNQNRLMVQTLSAETGGGTLAMGGFIAYERGLYFNLSATGKDIRIRYPQGVSAKADASLRYTGTQQSSLLSGDVLINRFDITPQFDLANYVARSGAPAPAPSTNPLVNNLKFDIHIISTSELEVQTSSGFKVTGDADLHIRGTAARPSVLGRIDISEGQVNFNNTKYQLDRGDILFTNPTMIEPIFNIEATTRVRDYDITLGFHGTPDRLNSGGITFRSDPPLAEGDIIALLALGHTREDSPNAVAQSTTTFTESASSAILGAALNTALSSRAQKLFGISQIKIDPSVGGADANPNARITIEQQVSGRVTLTYITNLAQSAQQVIQAEVQINRNLSVIGVRDQYGVVGFDVRYRQRKK